MSENALQLLMGMDYDKIVKVPEKEVRIKRLSEMAGADFFVKVRALSGKRFMELAGSSVGKNGKVDYSRAYDANVRILLAGIVEPDLKNKDLLERFHAATPQDLVNILFTGGEVGLLADAITELSGYGDDAEDEVKN